MLIMRDIDVFISSVCEKYSLSVQVYAPHDARGKAVAARLREFYAVNGQGYLNSEQHARLDRELALSSRSSTVVVQDNRGEIVSTVRLTPFPFESHGLLNRDVDFKAFREYVELSRLVSWSTTHLRSLPVSLVLGKALQASLLVPSFAGFVALAKSPHRRIFSKFGLQPRHAAPIPIRLRESGSYWFISGAAADVVRHALRQVEQTYEAHPQLTTSTV